MNCSYRILKNVYIGLRVRKTADSTTVPFDNEPFKGAEITRYDKLGFRLQHKNLPREIWLDFEQLPLTKLVINNGIIEDEITFVEKIFGRSSKTSMFLMPTKWFDYQELLHDKRIKDSSAKYSASQLTPGENVISALCREGTVMTYLGRFFVTNTAMINRYSYGNDKKFGYIDSAPERAFFAVEDVSKKGKYKIINYPVTNKTVAEMYKSSDKGGEAFNELFTDVDKNLDMIRYIEHTSAGQKYYWGWQFTESVKDSMPKFDFIIDGGSHSIYIGKTKTNINTEALEYAKKYLEAPNYEMYPTKNEAQSAYNRNSNRRGW